MKRRNYTFALTKDNSRIIKIVEKFPKYAYIKHDKDSGEIHYHYYIEFPNPRSLSSVARELSIPENMLEQVYSKCGILTYLTHENSPEKHHYDLSEVVANFDISKELLDDKSKTSHDDYWLIVNTLRDFHTGKITFPQLAETLEPLMRQGTPLRIFDIYSKMLSRNVWACHTFRVPCSNTSVTGTKKKGGKL